MSVHLDNADTWVGRLSMLAALTLPDLPADARRNARRALDDLLQSDAATEELKELIRQEMKP